MSDHGPAVTRWITGFVTGSAIPFARWILDTATKNGPKFISWLGDMRDKGVAFLGWVDQLTEKYGPKVDEFFTNFDASMGSAGEGSSFFPASALHSRSSPSRWVHWGRVPARASPTRSTWPA